MKILITGAGGYIGSKLVHKLTNKNHEVIAFDNFFYDQGPMVAGPLMHRFCDFHREDVRDWSDNLKDCIKRVDIIIPLAAIVGAPLCERLETDAYEINQKWVEDLMTMVTKDQVVIFPNTNSSYGSHPGVCDESTPINPLSHYAKTKQAAEDAVLKHKRSIVFRLATVFGWSYRPRIDLLVNNLIFLAHLQKHIDVFNGKARRNYIHIDDICNAFTYAVEHCYKMWDVYNLGNDRLNSTKEELAQKICDKMGATISFSDHEDPDKRDYEVSSARLEKAGFKASIGIDQAVYEMSKFYKTIPVHHLEKFRNY